MQGSRTGHISICVRRARPAMLVGGFQVRQWLSMRRRLDDRNMSVEPMRRFRRRFNCLAGGCLLGVFFLAGCDTAPNVEPEAKATEKTPQQGLVRLTHEE